MYIKNLILGAGISGISAANVLDKGETIVFEKENYYGGLCHSFEIQGFRFDTAIHLSFTQNEDVRKYFDKTNYYTHKPIAYNFADDIWLKHPVENNLFNLKNQEKINCIKSFVEKPQIENISNYKDWLISTYGEYIFNKFHNRYTNKYWCEDAKNLSTTWVGKRFNIPKIEKILEGSFSDETGIDYYAKEMRYPTKGGYQAFLNPILDNINIQLNKEAIKIDLKEKVVYFKDNTNCKYHNLISSIPLPKLISLMDDVPQNIVDTSKNLTTTSMVLASVGFNKESIPPYLWFYIYDEDILPARAYSPSLKSKDNVPLGCSSLQFEIYYTKEKALDKSNDDLINHIKHTLLKLKLCDEKDILFIDIRNIDYANVIFYKDMEKDRDTVVEYLKNNNVNLIGRFGEWKYLWSDQSFLSGKLVGEYVNLM
ncbi:MAG: protoporphyrinogen/coproporphyrinogen oxidase [Romboutsia sp.]|uniref:protoporphyrinogen/coproporphyrinogen oxidase n=1 Tax=Romboutsia sp. TaxID=1965302 RepID=UPI003F2E7D17